MGIQGLHKGLGFATRKTTIKDFRGQRLAIDSSSWLHRSVYSISEQYVEGIEAGRIDPSSVRVAAKYISGRCRELLDLFQIAKLFLVMDGKRCPLKADTNGERERKRKQNLKEARMFKRNGQLDKKEEKYKACIKIKDAFTEAVMKDVQETFKKDRRVQLVWSPYEADAQLAKLCLDRDADAVITEDSDVLVYSASSHVSFPVIFKLDRRSGTCDVISMDWLLQYKEDSNSTCRKKGSALEVLLKNLASRQARRPGFGVRLFVQGCVLAGCDYAPNKLAGVGLVNAFKHVRDSAFRNDSVRFAKVLDSMPRKYKQGIEVDPYELNLAKSEAVFYYHLVKHQDGTIKPLNAPPEDKDLHSTEKSHTQHLPAMQRFENDWSFLGESKEYKQLCPPAKSPSKLQPPVAEIVIQKSKPRSIFKPHQFTQQKNTSTKQTIRNPYAKDKGVRGTKRQRQSFTTPPQFELSNIGSSQSSSDEENMFSKFARRGTAMKKITKENIGFARKDGHKILESRKSMQSQESLDVDDECVPKQDLSSFYDLTDSNSACLDGESNDVHDSRPARVSLDPNGDDVSRNSESQSTGNGSPAVPDYDFDLPDPSPDRSVTFLGSTVPEKTRVSHGDPVVTCSKYFRSNKAQRIPVSETRHSEGRNTNSRQSLTPQTIKSNQSDEVIDSPLDTDLSKSNGRSHRRPSPPKPVVLSKRRFNDKPKGALQKAFQKQEELSQGNTSTTRQSWVRTVPLLPERRPKKQSTGSSLTSFFKPVKKSNRVPFRQIPLNTKQTDEEFLWNTP